MRLFIYSVMDLSFFSSMTVMLERSKVYENCGDLTLTMLVVGRTA